MMLPKLWNQHQKVRRRLKNGDPIQLVLTAITAVVSGMIGSRMKVHTVVQPPAPNIAERSSYGSTLGA